MRRLIIGDIHGMYREMMDVLERASFNPENDILFSTGDLADRGEESVSVLRFLLSLANFFPVLGNHDKYLLSYLDDGTIEDLWYFYNGGKETVGDFRRKNVQKEEKREMKEKLERIPVVRVLDNEVIIHGGIPEYLDYEKVLELSDLPARMQRECRFADDILWNRMYVRKAKYFEDNAIGKESAMDFSGHTLYVGHTPLPGPFFSSSFHVIDVDTGSFLPSGCITIMDMDTFEYWQSGKEDKRILPFRRD